MTMRVFSLLAAGAALFAFAACGPGNTSTTTTNKAPANQTAETNDKAKDPPADPGNSDKKPTGTEASRDAQVEKAWEYLKTMYDKPPSRDDPRGLLSGWGPKSLNVPYTAMTLQGLLGTSVWDPADPMITESVNWLTDTQEPTGGWSYMPTEQARGMRAVYCTGIVAQLFSELNTAGPWRGRLNSEIAKAVDYLKQSQVGNPEGPAPDYERESVGFGGWAYSREEIAEAVDSGGKPPANMSTTSFALDALRACGLDESDPLWQDALTFLKRNQNAGEVQEEGFEAVAKLTGPDGKVVERTMRMAGEGSPDHGGAIYSEETSKADGFEENEDGTVTLFSYGSMTYNLLRGYLFAGLERDSIPVRLAWGWIQRNYTVERVPGFRKPEQYDMGLYYYFLSMSKTLQAFGVDTVEEPERGLQHDWRADIVSALAERQKSDGSWINENHSRWQENSRVLCTAYALQALRHTR